MEEEKTNYPTIDELIEEAKNANTVISKERNKPDFVLMAEAAVNYYIDLDL